MIQINERHYRDEGGASVLLKEFVSRKVVCVCVRKLHFCVEERGEVQRKCSWNCVWGQEPLRLWKNQDKVWTKERNVIFESTYFPWVHLFESVPHFPHSPIRLLESSRRSGFTPWLHLSRANRVSCLLTLTFSIHCSTFLMPSVYSWLIYFRWWPEAKSFCACQALLNIKQAVS